MDDMDNMKQSTSTKLGTTSSSRQYIVKTAAADDTIVKTDSNCRTAAEYNS